MQHFHLTTLTESPAEEPPVDISNVKSPEDKRHQIFFTLSMHDAWVYLMIIEDEG